MKFIIDLKETTLNDKNRVGGKAFSLGKMINAGFNVPEGFVLLAEAFEFFLEKTDLNVEIEAEMDRIDLKKIHTVEFASEKIQSLILNAKFPDEISGEIFKFFNKLKSDFVAVRSSAALEDSEGSAWAGQLETFLNIKEDKVLLNIKKCWASFFSARAIFYRLEQGEINEKNSIAVVIQKMIESEKAGVAFSVHPVTQDENQIIIEAGFGLGEAIVSGEITPDSYVVSKKDLKIIDINVFKQTKLLKRAVDGGNAWINLKDKGEFQVLSNDEIIELSKIIKEVESFFGKAMDIEWAREKGRFYLTQSRPITTLTKKSNLYEKEKQETYKMIFESEGFSVFGAYLNFKAGYNEFGGVISCENSETVGLYIPDSKINLYSQRGLKIYQSNSKTENVIKKIREIVDEFEIEIKKLKKKDLSDLTKTELTELFNFFTTKTIKMLRYYKYTEEHYLFGVEEIIKKNIDDKTKISIFDVILGKTDLSFDNELLKLVVNVKKMAEFKLKIKEKFEIIFAEFFNINQEIARRREFGECDDIEALFNDEIKSLLDGNISYDEFKKIEKNRSDFFVINKMNGESEFIFSKEAERFLVKIKKQQETGLLKGQIANYGKAIGRAVVVPYVTDSKNVEYLKIAKNFKEGDILVAKNTTPAIMTIIKKAGAIVTEEGGITCHGAIVAREFNKPGIVGVRGISKKVKTGDLIEVDADNGVMRIL